MPPGTFWIGRAEDADGPFKVRLVRRLKEHVDQGSCEWVLFGESGTCGQIQGFAEGTGRRFTRAYYADKGLPVPPPPIALDVRLLERVEFDGNDFRTFPVEVPCVLHFRNVRWKYVDCGGIDSICGGKVELNATWEVVPQEEPCDEPLVVGAMS